MSLHSHVSDYSRYFCPRQKVYLVNMSAERDNEIYESLSGVVTSSNMDSLELMIPHSGNSTLDDDGGKTTYKLTSEALGSGIQVLVDLTSIVSGNIFQFRIHGTLEMFQRRVVPRIEFTSKIFQMCGNYPLAFFRKEWKRVMDHQRTNGVPPRLVLKETEINLSAGGIGFAVDPASRPTPLSMLFVELGEGLPVCALAEIVWEQKVGEKRRYGFRFIYILKTDQERINRFIGDALSKSGGAHLDYTRNWVLVDKMATDD
ncbi:MAG: PilZ domain-containing protein, partial [Desulfuromonadaceae bacterium]